MWRLQLLQIIIITVCFSSPNIFAAPINIEADQEYVEGILCYNNNDYQSAIEHFRSCIELEHSAEVKTTRDNYYSAWLAHCYYLLGQKDQAEEIAEYYMATPIDCRNTIHIDSIYAIATHYFDKKEYLNAYPYYQECVNLIKNQFPDNHIFYSGIFEEYALASEMLYRFEESITLRQELVRLKQSYYGPMSRECADALMSLCSNEVMIGAFDIAIERAQEALYIYGTLKETDLKYQVLCKISNYQSLAGRYNEAIQTILQVINEIKETDTINSPIYLLALNDYADYLLMLGNITEGIKICDEALSLCEQDYKNNAAYATTLNVKANLEQSRGNYNESIKYYEDALEIRRSLYGENHPEYAIVLNNMARSYMGLGQYQYCIELATKVLSIYLQYYGQKEENYATGLNNLADYYDKLGNVEQSVIIESEALKLWEGMYGKNHPDYAMALTIIANYQSKLGYQEQAVNSILEALTIKEKIFGRNNPDYALSLNNLAYFNSLLGNYKTAIEEEHEVLNIIKNSVGITSPDYAMSFMNLAEFYENYGMVDSALFCLEQSKSLYEASFGTNNPSYAYCIGKLALLYTKNGEKEKAEDFAEATTRIYKDIVLDNFRFLTGYGRNHFWGMYESWFENTLPDIANTSRTDNMSAVLYDGQLLRKGLLLNADLALRNLLVESGDTVMLQTYDELADLKRSVQKYQEQNLLTKESLDSINMVIAKSEKTLVDKSQAYGDYTSNLTANWIDVKESLSNEELAIEYVCFQDEDGINHYAALVLSSNSEIPHYYYLCTEDSLVHLFEQDKYSVAWGKDLLELLLFPVISNRDQIKTIYFSPDGIIHNIPLENLIQIDESNDSNLSLCRLSSTRQLIKKVNSPQIESASLFGGISYDANSTNNIHNELVSDNAYESLILRSSLSEDGYMDLPSTEIEVININDILVNNHVTTSIYMHDDATESAFKLIADKSGVIHIATHGFYWTEQHALSWKNKNALLPIVMNNVFDDEALTRSGLILAGANRLIRDRIKVPGTEDGILTAREISNLDLRNIDLVVLSACQTGLGEVSGEGVFGLQRGFKKAGAHSIVMSLWSVDDEATRILMEEFYKNLAQGESKQLSLTKAQHFLRTTYSVYSSPYFWAAFIILDPI